MSIASSSQICVILAGGLGTRLREKLQGRPKCLAPVGGRTFLDIQMGRLSQAGVTDFVLSLGYGAGLVIESLAQSQAALRIRHVVEAKMLGTGGAVAHVLDELALDEVLVANGDTYLDGDISPMLMQLDRLGGELLRLAAVVVPDRDRFGGVESNAAGRVARFLEKGQQGGGLINAGLYRLCRAALPRTRQGAYSLETEVLPSLVQQESVTLRVLDGRFIDIGIPEDYERFRNEYVA